MTPIQVTALLSFIALMAVCIWAGRAWPPTLPWAIAIFLWAANSTAFYIYYLFVRGGVADEIVVFWSAMTRIQSIILAAGGLWIAVMKGRQRDE